MQFDSPTMKSLHDALDFRGAPVMSRAGATRELVGVTITYPLGVFPTRVKMSRHLIVTEACSILGGTFNMQAIRRAVPKADPALFGPLARYGLLMKAQLPAFVSLLRRDPATRRAVVYLGRPTTALGDNAPCTNSVQGIVREGRLSLIVSMRSWDIVFGLPYDVAVWGCVGTVIATHLGLLPGTLTVTTGSLHMYACSENLAKPGIPVLQRCRLLMPALNASWTQIWEYAQGMLVILGTADSRPEHWLVEGGTI